MIWTAEKIDVVLESLLSQDSELDFYRECAVLADQLECGDNDVAVADKHVRDGDPVTRFFWGICTRVREYDGPASKTSRTRRSGPLTWTERKCIFWAANCKSAQQKVKANANYLAKLMQRPIEVVEKETLRVGPARGRTGFFA
jgi:hypothetical protein